MSVLSAQSIRQRVHAVNGGIVTNFLPMQIEPFSESKQACGMSYGLTGAGYDIRLGKIGKPAWTRGDNERAGDKNWTDSAAQSWMLQPGSFILAASLERFELPNDIQAIVHDKSTLARQGLALQNTVLEPGWEGFITLELSNHGPKPIRILVGQPIAQIVFHQLDHPTELPYRGKYQNQDNLPTEAKFTGESQ